MNERESRRMPLFHLSIKNRLLSSSFYSMPHCPLGRTAHKFLMCLQQLCVPCHVPWWRKYFTFSQLWVHRLHSMGKETSDSCLVVGCMALTSAVVSQVGANLVLFLLSYFPWVNTLSYLSSYPVVTCVAHFNQSKATIWPDLADPLCIRSSDFMSSLLFLTGLKE